MARGPRLVGSRARILMQRTAPAFGAGMSNEEPHITVVTVYRRRPSVSCTAAVIVDALEEQL